MIGALDMQQSIQSHVSSVFGPVKAHAPEHYGARFTPTQTMQQPLLNAGPIAQQQACQRTQHGLLVSFLILLVGMAIIAMLASALGGCASTTLHTPIGDYTSTKDTQLDHLIITIEKHADGSETTHVEVGGAGGQASTVIAAQGAIIQAAIEAGMAAGAKAVVPIP